MQTRRKIFNIDAVKDALFGLTKTGSGIFLLVTLGQLRIDGWVNESPISLRKLNHLQSVSHIFIQLSKTVGKLSVWGFTHLTVRSDQQLHKQDKAGKVLLSRTTSS